MKGTIEGPNFVYATDLQAQVRDYCHGHHKRHNLGISIHWSTRRLIGKPKGVMKTPD